MFKDNPFINGQQNMAQNMPNTATGYVNAGFAQEKFDRMIGQLDRVLSQMVLLVRDNDFVLDDPNRQTLKHHAEDMQAAAEKILKELGVVTK